MFINDRIITKPVSLKEAAAAAQSKPKVRPLNEILAEIDAKNKAVKTAGSKAQTKTASVEAPKVEPKVEAKAEPKVAVAASNVQVKVAEMPAFIKEKIEEKKNDGEGKKDEDKKEEKKDEKPAFLEKKDEEKDACMASTQKSLKIAKKLDFRPWKAEEVVSAWKQHGSMEKCMANVTASKNDKGEPACNDPKTYCGLLQVASVEADKMVKAASTQAPAADAPKAPVFKKIAKLTEKERTLLGKYYTKLYGKDYVDALLENY